MKNKIDLKCNLKIGDVVRSHDLTSDGFLIGVVYNKEIIWRPLAVYPIWSKGIDGISILREKSYIKEYQYNELENILSIAKSRGIQYHLIMDDN